MSEFGSYTGEQFFGLYFPPRSFLIDKFIKEKDSVIVVGEEKSGKSILIFQLITALTSQHPFLDVYPVAKPCKVTYVQLEGELQDSQDRFNRMIGSADFEPTLFHMLFSPPLQLQTLLGITKLIEDIELVHKPDVIIIDPIYFAMTGSLSDDETVRQFVGNIRILKDHFQCTIILVHHCHKIKTDQKGRVLTEGDNAIFGSVFFKAWADHTFLLRYDKPSETRHLTCDTQRAGDIIKDLKLKLIQPNPLYFEVVQSFQNVWGRMYEFFRNNHRIEGYTWEEVAEKLNIERHAFYRSVKTPLADGILTSFKIGRTVYYRLMDDPKNG